MDDGDEGKWVGLMLIAASSVELRETRPCSVFTTSINVEVKSSSGLPVSNNVLCPSVEVVLSCMAISLFEVVLFADCKGAASPFGLHNNVFLRVGDIVFVVFHVLCLLCS